MAGRPTGSRSTLREYLTELGLNSGLKIVLDASDTASYGGSGQTWSDTSGNGYHFYLGSGSSSDSADPTFAGTAGQQSSGEYFSLDGGDYFTLNQANPSWANNFHKSGAKFSILQWIYINNVSSATELGQISDLRDDNGGTGFSFGCSATVARAAAVGIYNGSASVTYSKRSTTIANNNAWNLIGVSIDIAAGTVNMLVNNTLETYTSQSYVGINTADAGGTLHIGRTDLGHISPAGTRFQSLAVWEGVALTGAQLQAVYNATRAKFGI